MMSAAATMQTNTRRHSGSKSLHIALWVGQALLAAAFLMAGSLKLFTPIAELATSLPWAAQVPEGLVRFIGAAEFAAAFGLVVPAAARVKPWLTPLAALGLVVVMLLAAGFHLSRGEANALPINLSIAALAAFVAWGRTKRAAIAERR
jgi:putative oxidoreductase